MSPTVFRERGYRFFFFSREESRPHVYVYSGDGEAKFWLGPPVTLAGNDGFSTRQLREMPLIEAGLLDGLDATTHWAWCDVLRERHPSVRVRKQSALIRPRGGLRGSRLLQPPVPPQGEPHAGPVPQAFGALRQALHAGMTS